MKASFLAGFFVLPDPLGCAWTLSSESESLLGLGVLVFLALLAGSALL
ncbi:MAG: hypothetical protein ACWA5R_10230 [bacterium]